MVWGRGWRNWEAEGYSLCRRWLRAVLLVNWPEKAGLFSIQSLWELKCCLCSQMSKQELIQEKDLIDVVATWWIGGGKQESLLKNNSDLCIFLTPNLAAPRTQTTALVCFFFLKSDFCRFVSAARGQQENREMCFPLCGVINDRHTHSDTHKHVCVLIWNVTSDCKS